jgi:zinc finger HIT domain-containing protein 1
MIDEDAPEKKKRTRKFMNKVARQIRFGKINVNKYFTYERPSQTEDLIYPNYNNIVVKSKIRNVPVYKICNVCFGFANYTCPRCYDRYCSKECYKSHKEIKCIKYLEL